MAYITKRGSSYSVRYTYQDEHGKSCDKWESFPTKEEAVKRQKQIEHELATGNFLIPSTVTVAEFLMDWLPKQCSKHKWAPKTYQSNLALIQNLIIPYIGEMQMQKLRPYHIEALYDTLSKTPCGQYVGGKRRDLSPKQQKRTLSGTTLHEVHQLLHNSFLLAVEWGILIKSPVPVEAPKKTTQERCIWEVEEMRAALDSMEDPILHLAVHLTLVGALREGEVAGLTPEDIDFDAANGMGTFTVNRSMQRVQKDTLAQVDKGCILRIFPDKLEGSKTSLILKDTKTEASCRTIFMTAALREELKQWLERLKREEALDPERYRNSGMLLRLPNGLAVEPVLIRKKFLKWQDAHPEFPRIVFHGLRHSSATYQLMISGGDIKAVQGTTGHASADMLVNTYAHIQQSSRVELGKKFESGFYAKPDTPSPQKDTLAQVDKGCILRIFPDKLEGSKTSHPEGHQDRASCRTIFMTAALREDAVAERLKREEALTRSGTTAGCSCLVWRWSRCSSAKFLKWQDAHPEFPRIVFHGLRHSSATYQLMISGGDIKAVQGTAGHASADMLVNTYAHIQQSSRVELGKKFESGFYAKPTPQPAGCTRRRRIHHLHDGSGIAQGCRPGNEGKAPPGPAHLMQKRALIAMQCSALHNRTWKTPTVQKPCRNRAAMAHKTKKP